MAVQTGIAVWASITNPNTTFDPVYCLNLVVEDKIATDFKDRGFPVKDMDEGPALVIKRKVSGPNGSTRPAPKLFDRSKKNGRSLVRVKLIKVLIFKLFRFLILYLTMLLVMSLM